MILVDTSVWVNHLRQLDTTLAGLLNTGRVLVHPFVIGELVLGGLLQNGAFFDALTGMPTATVALDAEILSLISANSLSGHGIGYVDAHLLGAVMLTPGATLWTHDQRLAMAADRLGVTARLQH